MSTRTSILRRVPDSDYSDEAVRSWQRLIPELVGAPELMVGMRLRRATMLLEERLRDAVQTFPDVDNYGDYQVLSLLRRAGEPMMPSEIADQLRVTRAGVSGRLKRLKTRGLVLYLDDASDGRRARISLTGEGRVVVDDAFRSLQDAQRRFFTGLQEEHREAMSEALRALLVLHDDMAVGQLEPESQ